MKSSKNDVRSGAGYLGVRVEALRRGPRRRLLPLGALGQFRAGLAGLLRLWGDREFERQYLSTLNDQQLRALGLTREQMRWEVSKPFWKE